MKKVLFAVVLIWFISFFTNCSKDDESTSGGLVIKVKLDGFTGYQDSAYVDLWVLPYVYGADPIMSLATDASGRADFGQLNPGRYFYDGFYEIDDDIPNFPGGSTLEEYYNYDSVLIVAGTNLERTLILY